MDDLEGFNGGFNQQANHEENRGTSKTGGNYPFKNEEESKGPAGNRAQMPRPSASNLGPMDLKDEKGVAEKRASQFMAMPNHGPNGPSGAGMRFKENEGMEDLRMQPSNAKRLH